MPIYEYEPVDHDCLICPNRVGVIQSITDEHLQYCPDCGMKVRRVISSVAIKIENHSSYDLAGRRGFSVWKKAGEATWEKLAGPGADVIVGDPKDIAAVKQESRPSKVLDLDKTD